MTLLPESLRHYLPMLIAAQIIIFASAILVGGFLIIRRLSRRPPLDGQILEEKEKLAAEIHAEILRLRDLRDRLFDGFSEKAEPAFSAKPKQQSPGPSGETPVAGSSAREAELQKANAELQAQVAALKAEIDSLKSKLASAATPVTAPAPNVDELRKTIEKEVGDKLRAEASGKQAKQEATIRDLTSRLEEYEIFEEELAQIKKYKMENDQLKQQVSAGGGGLPAGFSEDDISQLFNEMTAGGANFESTEALLNPTDGAASPGSEDPKAAPIVDLSAAASDKESRTEVASNEPSLDAELERALLGEEAQELVAPLKIAGAAPADFVAEDLKEEPDVIAVDTENAEAMAMLGGDQDELMREFEKVLGAPNKDKQ
jgi:hypothetical protein